jgi:hypothetical protein
MSDPISEDAQYLLIVQHGRDDVFLSLKDRIEAPGQLQVMWDRRVGERRKAESSAHSEHRAGDRRHANLLGNVLAILLAAPPPGPPSSSRPAA